MSNKRIALVVPRLDLDDPILAFLYFWVEEFLKQADSVIVVALKGSEKEKEKVEGKGGRVYLLNNYSRLFKLFGIARVLIKERKNYDSVISFMYPEMAIVSGLVGGLLRKRRAMWYTHGRVSWRLRMAIFFNNVVFTASDKSMRVRTEKKKIIGHGIPTQLFYPSNQVKREKVILSVGRINKSKNFEVIIDALPYLMDYELWIVGPVYDREYFEDLKKKIKNTNLANRVKFLGEVEYIKMPEIYRKASVFVSASQTGSIDKAVLEAMFCGVPVLVNNEVYRDLLGEEFDYLYFRDEQELVERILNVRPLSNKKVLRSYQLKTLISNIFKFPIC